MTPPLPLDTAVLSLPDSCCEEEMWHEFWVRMSHFHKSIAALHGLLWCHFSTCFVKLYRCNSCHLLSIIQQDITVYEKEKDIISVVSGPSYCAINKTYQLFFPLFWIVWDIEGCKMVCFILKCRQLVAVCDEILNSCPEALLTHTAQLESVDLVPVSPGDQLVRPSCP